MWVVESEDRCCCDIGVGAWFTCSEMTFPILDSRLAIYPAKHRYEWDWLAAVMWVKLPSLFNPSRVGCRFRGPPLLQDLSPWRGSPGYECNLAFSIRAFQFVDRFTALSAPDSPPLVA